MSRHFFILVFMLLLLADNSICRAQQQKTTGGNTHSFIPREITIFEDDFSQDSVGTFPSKWHITGCNNSNQPNFDNKSFWKIEQEKNEHSLSITTTFRYIKPNINELLPDSFTIGFDYILDSLKNPDKPQFYTCAELYFYYSESNDPCEQMSLHLNHQGRMLFTKKNKTDYNEVSYPGEFDNKSWHHFALSYNKRHIDCYWDSYHVLSLPDCGFTPYGIALGCWAPVKYKRFRITTTKENNTFANLLTENKFTTHAINFDVNKSIIKPESMGFITQLAQFMKANPAIKLEIDGHTDNDGDAAANVQLSQQRADEVKKQLLAAGVSGGRLTTRGLGATKPLQPNTTPEAKANNRRVEFIKFQ